MKAAASLPCLVALLSFAACGGEAVAPQAKAGAAGAAGSVDGPRPLDHPWPARAGAGGAAGAAHGGGGLGGSSAGAAGTAGSAGAGGSAGAAGGAAIKGPKPKCKRSASQVIVLGDSYLNWFTHTFPEDMSREAGEMWRLYAAGGCSLGSGGFCTGLQIPEQLELAIAEDPDIVAGVMTGGGNDILVADGLQFPGGEQCKELKESPTMQVCQEIVSTALSAAEKLMDTAASAGIRDVVYLFYPHIPGGGLAGENPNALLDYALPKAKALCDGAQTKTQGKLRCHFLDLVPVFNGHPDWFADDGIHQNPLGSAAMAREVMKVMKAACIAQPETSACCEP